jgi:hypothetical protein
MVLSLRQAGGESGGRMQTQRGQDCMKFIEQNSRALGIWLLCFVVGYIVGGLSTAMLALGANIGISLVVSGK